MSRIILHSPRKSPPPEIEVGKSEVETLKGGYDVTLHSLLQQLID